MKPILLFCQNPRRAQDHEVGIEPHAFRRSRDSANIPQGSFSLHEGGLR